MRLANAFLPNLKFIADLLGWIKDEVGVKPLWDDFNQIRCPLGPSYG
jgi:hypothetical protein